MEKSKFATGRFQGIFLFFFEFGDPDMEFYFLRRIDWKPDSRFAFLQGRCDRNPAPRMVRHPASGISITRIAENPFPSA